ncbi:MAG: hypothetical protein QM820_31985 [Minicystis sp.]
MMSAPSTLTVIVTAPTFFRTSAKASSIALRSGPSSFMRSAAA